MFAADITVAPHRYLSASLPRLPIPDAHFDLVVSSHLLFTYDDRFHLGFHLEAIRELLRVSHELRVFPLLGMQHRRSVFVPDVLDSLHAGGGRDRDPEGGYEFQRGGNELLIIRR